MISQKNKNEVSKLKVFENRTVRTEWDGEKEDWYFSVVDVVAVLTEQDDFNVARKYWNKLKQRLNEEGSQLVTNCHQLKMLAADGKMRLTDTLDSKGILRLVQSIPSKKAEPFNRKSRKYFLKISKLPSAAEKSQKMPEAKLKANLENP